MFQHQEAPEHLSDRVAGTLRQRIESNEWAPQYKLPIEAQLAQEFGVSRTVVREAIARLKNEGLVRGRQGSGVFVTDSAAIRPLRIDAAEIDSLDAVLSILELRRALESECAGLAARRRTEEQMNDINAALQNIEADIQAGRVGVEADMAFHQAVARASGNPYLLQTLRFFAQYLAVSIKMTRSNEARREAYTQQVLDEHTAIAAAINAGDPLAAQSAAQTHMFNASRRLIQELGPEQDSAGQ